jgi:hypothetical protein
MATEHDKHQTHFLPTTPRLLTEKLQTADRAVLALAYDQEQEYA